MPIRSRVESVQKLAATYVEPQAGDADVALRPVVHFQRVVDAAVADELERLAQIGPRDAFKPKRYISRMLGEGLGDADSKTLVVAAREAAERLSQTPGFAEVAVKVTSGQLNASFSLEPAHPVHQRVTQMLLANYPPIDVEARRAEFVAEVLALAKLYAPRLDVVRQAQEKYLGLRRAGRTVRAPDHREGIALAAPANHYFPWQLGASGERRAPDSDLADRGLQAAQAALDAAGLAIRPVLVFAANAVYVVPTIPDEAALDRWEAPVGYAPANEAGVAACVDRLEAWFDGAVDAFIEVHAADNYKRMMAGTLEDARRHIDVSVKAPCPDDLSALDLAAALSRFKAKLVDAGYDNVRLDVRKSIEVRVALKV